MKKKALYVGTLLLIAAFPLGNTFFQIFRGVSVSFFHHFERRAPFTVNLPPFFNKYIHFYITDFWIVGLLIGVFWLKEGSWKELFFNRHSRFLTIYGGVAIASIIFSIFATYYFQYTTIINLMIAFIAFHIIYLLLSKRDRWIEIALWAFIGVAAVESIIGVGQFFMQKSLGLYFLSEVQINPDMDNIAVYPLTEGSRALFDKLPWIPKDKIHILRAHGTFDHPNIFGGYLLIALFVAYYLFINAKNYLQKGFLLVLIPFLILTLTLTFARGPFFAWILGTFLFFGMGFIRNMKGFFKLASIIGSAFLGVIAFLFQQLVARGGFVNYNALANASDSKRFLYYKLASILFLKHPFLGIGHNGFALFPYEILDPFYGKANPLGVLPHNVYLQIASETGAVGLTLIGLFVISLILRALKQRLTPLSLTLLTILFSLLLVGIVDHFLWAYNVGRLMMLIFCALLAAYTKARECLEHSHSK